ncbi:hypothetical protein NDA16_002018 [Ustilago loliicola]|nr:hypothetical protein NDA16_002018 [Ustilago loliicola]
MPLNFLTAPHPAAPETDPRYDGDSKFSHTVLPAGWKSSSANKALEEDLIFEKNVSIRLRDGVRILTDIFRPVSDGKVPAILVWSPYGKTGRGRCSLSAVSWLNAGVLPSSLSGLEKFEGPDPARWCPQGYAIINIDPRGTYDSEGVQSPVPSRQTCLDSYDAIEWLAKQPWCSGKIGATGNSQLAMSQYFIGESQAPHLAALAPWEGLTDNYRSVVARGGVLNLNFAKAIFGLLCGRDQLELMFDQMLQPCQDGLYREHMRDTSASPSLIKVPLLRFHGGQEWNDYYSQQDELQRFFDRYLKDLPNDWEATPRVRYQLIEFAPTSNPKTLPYTAAEDFPPKEMEEIKLHLGSNNVLLPTQQDSQDSQSYDSSDPDAVASFTWKPESDVGIVGLPRVRLLACNDSEDDFDVYISLRKLDKQGKVLVQYCWPLEDLQSVASAEGEPVPQSHDDIPDLSTAKYIGPTGQIRASHRKTRAPQPGDEEDNLSWPGWPFHPHDEKQPVPAGTIVELETGIWPASISIRKGEALRLDLTPVSKELFDLPFQLQDKITSSQKGQQTFYFGGGKYDAYLILPTVKL